MTPRFNLCISAIGIFGSLTLPELAATCAEFATAFWMLVQCYLAIRKAQRGSCTRTNCTRRSGP